MVHDSIQSIDLIQLRQGYAEPIRFTTSGARVGTVKFRSDEVRRQCCDLEGMRKKWGRAGARRISQRLQQLEATVSVADLDFLPFTYQEHDDGTIEVMVHHDLAISIEFGREEREGEVLMHAITIVGVGARSSMAIDS